MAIVRHGRRRFLKSVAIGGGIAFASARLGALGRAAEPPQPAQVDLDGLRAKVEHIVVIFQENRSFDHYFGAYRSPTGAAVETLLDKDGKVDKRFTGLQKNEAGIPYSYLPVPSDVPGFASALLENRPFPLAAYIPAGSNVPWDPQHHFFRMRAQVNNGLMDRFVALSIARKHAPFDAAAQADPLRMMFEESAPSGVVLGYYTRDDLPDYHHLADNYVLFDHFFQAMSGGSTGNALYLAAARSAVSHEVAANKVGSLTPPVFDMPYDGAGVMINDLPPVNGPTYAIPGWFENIKIAPPPDEQTYPNIGDRLNAANLSWAWYNQHWNAVKPWALKTAFGPGDGSAVIDTFGMYTPHHNPFQYYPSWAGNVKAGHIRDSDDFFADVKAGTLPRVSFIKATSAQDEHPANSAPRSGEQWVMRLLRALGGSALWDKTAVIFTYDEGGGIWDHVAPPQPDSYGCGTRIPALLVSPWARKGYVDHRVADTTSVLALIEARFGLQPLQERDGKAYNLLDGLDFTQQPREPSFG